MSQSLGSGLVTADVTGAVTTALIAAKSATTSNSSSGNTTIGTVGAGKVWKIIGFDVVAVGATNIAVIGGGDTYMTVVNNSATYGTFCKVGFVPGCYIDTLTAGETVVENSSVANSHSVTVYYVEEDA